MRPYIGVYQFGGMQMTVAEMRAMLDRDAKLIENEEFDKLMDVYINDAIMVLPGQIIQGKEALKIAHKKIAKYFDHTLKLRHGNMKLFETGDTILVLDQTFVESDKFNEERKATYVYRKINGEWLCAIDNSYGTALLDE